MRVALALFPQRELAQNALKKCLTFSMDVELVPLENEVLSKYSLTDSISKKLLVYLSPIVLEKYLHQLYNNSIIVIGMVSAKKEAYFWTVCLDEGATGINFFVKK